MKKIIILVCLILMTGCSKAEEKEIKKEKENIIGSWVTTYDLGAFKGVSEKYIFKENNECVRILNTGSEITDSCTYEFNEDKSKIRIIWENKIDKESFSKYVEVDEKTIMISEHTYKREVQNEK